MAYMDYNLHFECEISIISFDLYFEFKSRFVSRFFCFFCFFFARIIVYCKISVWMYSFIFAKSQKNALDFGFFLQNRAQNKWNVF